MGKSILYSSIWHWSRVNRERISEMILQKRFDEFRNESDTVKKEIWQRHVLSLPEWIRERIQMGTWATPSSPEVDHYLSQFRQKLACLTNVIEIQKVNAKARGVQEWKVVFTVSTADDPHEPDWVENIPQFFCGFEIDLIGKPGPECAEDDYHL